MKRAKIRRPDAIKLSNEEIDARCDHILKLMDAELAKREWLALGRPTIADISCFGPISMLKVSGYDTDKWPNVTRWLERIKALPGAHDIDGNPFCAARTSLSSRRRTARCRSSDRRSAGTRGRCARRCGRSRAASSSADPTPTSYSVPRARSRARIAAADSADVGEHGPADAEQPPRIEVREEALLDVQRSCGSRRLGSGSGSRASRCRRRAAPGSRDRGRRWRARSS